MNKLYSYIFYFSITSIIAFFMAVFIFQVGDEMILTPINLIGNNSADDLGISTQMKDSLHDSLNNYRQLNIPYDLFFLASFIGVVILSLMAAYESREESYMSFFGAITIGLMIFLVLTSFIEVIKDWLVLNLIQNVISFDLTTTPIFNFYLENIGIINFIWAFILIIVNKLTFTLSRSDDDINDFTEPAFNPEPIDNTFDSTFNNNGGFEK